MGHSLSLARKAKSRHKPGSVNSDNNAYARLLHQIDTPEALPRLDVHPLTQIDAYASPHLGMHALTELNTHASIQLNTPTSTQTDTYELTQLNPHALSQPDTRITLFERQALGHQDLSYSTVSAGNGGSGGGRGGDVASNNITSNITNVYNRVECRTFIPATRHAADYQRPSSRSAAEAYGTLINERERLRLNMRTVAYSLAQAAWVGRHFKNPDGTPLNYEEREATLYKNLHALAEDPRSLLLAPNVPVHETRGCCLLGSHRLNSVHARVVADVLQSGNHVVSPAQVLYLTDAFFFEWLGHERSLESHRIYQKNGARVARVFYDALQLSARTFFFETAGG